MGTRSPACTIFFAPLGDPLHLIENMSEKLPPSVPAEMMAALRRRLDAGAEALTMEGFIDCVLYDPQVGYYRQNRQRVGRSAASDFYTASSLGPLFAELVLQAVRDLLPGKPDACTFVEAGPESEKGILGSVGRHPFPEVRLVRPGTPMEIPPRAVVFSNELFDAQPFRRFIRSGGRWMEAGVRMEANHLEPALMDPGNSLPFLPAVAPEGYTIDWPERAHQLLDSIAGQDWQGLFLAFDYGLDRQTLLEERPGGTGRTYASHRIGADLLADPGRTDITCHVVWDEMEAILARHGFRDIRVQRQETFLMRHAEPVIRQVLESSDPGFSPRKQTLMELLHPENMGHKFQVLSATRGEF